MCVCGLYVCGDYGLYVCVLQGQDRPAVVDVDVLIRLVCSDVMARGMDVDGVKYVVSYDRPPFVSTYIHRVGRTARAGRAGTALSLLENKEFFHFKRMMRQAGKWRGIREMKFSRQALQTLVEPFQAALAQLPRIIQVSVSLGPVVACLLKAVCGSRNSPSGLANMQVLPPVTERLE
ncbi:hypothetical protein ACOMHN_002448 [Nucella lapillus]